MHEAVFERVFARARNPLATGFRLACATCLLIFFLCSLGYSRSHDTAGASFSIDLDKPFAEVLNAVSDVAHSGAIKGTFEYRDEEQLNGAQFEEKSQLFSVWSGAGKVLYKVRAKTLSPSHFLNSNDVGTVAVRYVVQEVSPNSTRLFIDAVFIENARHHGHPSDGYVETCEFGEIGKRLKERDQLQTQVAAGDQFSPGHESSSRSDASPENEQPNAHPPAPSTVAPVEVVDSAKLADLRRAISEQKTQLASESAKLDQLEAQARQLRTSKFVRVKGDRVELKSLPYAHSRVVEALTKGQEVTVLSKSMYWYQVRSEDGKEGWISHTFVELQP